MRPGFRRLGPGRPDFFDAATRGPDVPLGISAGALFVFAGILVALVLFATERGLSGSASAATLTVLAMFVLSDGVQRTGVVRIPGRKVASLTGNSEGRQLGATIRLVILVAVILLLTSLCYLWIQTLSAWIPNSSFHVLTATSISHISGFINNTAAVAILLSMVTNLAHEGETSPSKLLMALSYAPTFGGMLTLIGTSTNILASELSGRLIGRTFTMFEFTQLGIIVSVVGTVYLLTVGRYLTLARIPVARDLTAEFEMGEYLTEVVVREDSPLVGRTIGEALRDTDFDVDLVQLIRGDRTFTEPLDPKTIQAGDVFAVRTDRDTLVEVVVAPGSSLVGESLATANFRQRMDHVRLRVGDTLLV